jgi:hypothetical protein
MLIIDQTGSHRRCGAARCSLLAAGAAGAELMAGAQDSTSPDAAWLQTQQVRGCAR